MAAWLTVLVGACSTNSAQPELVRVASGESIQTAVDAAATGSLILIEPGTYNESVAVTTEGLTIRGVDRKEVILDGGGDGFAGIAVYADGVTVENLTTTGYIQAGVLFSGIDPTGENDRSLLDGFRASHITAYNNEQYGIYSLQAGNGEIVNTYTSGNADSGIYVGQCGTPDASGQPSEIVDGASTDPCNVLVRNNIAELNALGYSGTNASQVWVVDNVFRNNRVGITPNSQSLEFFQPQTDARIVGNLVLDNDTAAAPEQAGGGFAVGIAIGSGVGNLIERNYVAGHDSAGIAITQFDRFIPVGNEVRDNVLVDNKIDLGYWLVGGETPIADNCFANNTFMTSHPENIEVVMPCNGDPGDNDDSGTTVTVEPIIGPTSPEGPRFSDVPAPAVQPSLDGDLEAFPPSPQFVEPDLATIQTPSPENP